MVQGSSSKWNGQQQAIFKMKLIGFREVSGMVTKKIDLYFIFVEKSGITDYPIAKFEQEACVIEQFL